MIFVNRNFINTYPMSSIYMIYNQHLKNKMNFFPPFFYNRNQATRKNQLQIGTIYFIANCSGLSKMANKKRATTEKQKIIQRTNTRTKNKITGHSIRILIWFFGEGEFFESLPYTCILSEFVFFRLNSARPYFL